MRIGERIYFGRPARRFNDISSRTLRRFALGLRFVCEMCARPEWFVREFCQAVQDGRRTSRPRSARVSLNFVGTPLAHLQTHDIATLAIRRPGLADAGSAYR